MSYIDLGHDLKDSNIFTIIALFGNLTYPVGVLVNFNYFILL